MGNTNCIAGGGTPHRADITIINNSPIDLHLDKSRSCGRSCNHGGWIITDGKIVEGHLPPDLIEAYNEGSFSVSGREATAVAPTGKAFYFNPEANLKVEFAWDYHGWTSWSTNAARMKISGKPLTENSFNKKMLPWNEVLIGRADSKTWTYEMKKSKGTIGDALDAINNGNVRIEL